MVDEMCSNNRVHRFDHILISTDFNAGVMEIPTYGLYGPPVRYLEVGIPMMRALSPEQFRAVIAHELGHSAGADGQLGVWIYNLNRTWKAIYQGLPEKATLLKSFIRWYYNYFDAYTLPMRRQQEFAADKFAARIVGAETAALALMSTAADGPYISAKYWPERIKNQRFFPQPNFKPFTPMFEGDARPTDIERQRGLRMEWRAKTQIDDEHPSLSDRLANLGYKGIPVGPDKPLQVPLPLPPAPDESAAQRYLGQWLYQYTEILDQEWLRANSESWAMQFRRAENKRTQIAAWLQKLRECKMPPESERNLAEAVYELKSPQEGIDLMRELVSRRPADADHLLLLGFALLAQGDASGVEIAERAVAMRASLMPPAYSMIADYYEARGEFEKADAYESTGEKKAGYRGYVEERIPIAKTDEFVAHELSEEVLQSANFQLSAIPNIGMAYLAKRTVGVRPDRPLFVLVFVPQASAFGQLDDADINHIAFDIRKNLELPGDLAIETSTGRTRWLRNRLQGIPGSKVFDSRDLLRIKMPGTEKDTATYWAVGIALGVCVMLFVTIMAISAGQIKKTVMPPSTPAPVAHTQPAMTPAAPPPDPRLIHNPSGAGPDASTQPQAGGPQNPQANMGNGAIGQTGYPQQPGVDNGQQQGQPQYPNGQPQQAVDNGQGQYQNGPPQQGGGLPGYTGGAQQQVQPQPGDQQPNDQTPPPGLPGQPVDQGQSSPPPPNAGYGGPPSVDNGGGGGQPVQ